MLLFLEVSSIDYDGNNLVSGDTKGVINIYQPHVQSEANPQGLGIVLFTNQTHQRSVTGIHLFKSFACLHRLWSAVIFEITRLKGYK